MENLDANRPKETRDIMLRWIVTCVLIIVAGVLFAVAHFSFDDPASAGKTILYSVASGVVVLGTAGVWVSYFAERLAVAYMAKRVSDFNSTLSSEVNRLEQGVSLLATASRAGVSHLYYQEAIEQPERHDAAYKNRIAHLLKKRNSRIRILAIAGRDFFHPGKDLALEDLHDFARHDTVEVLLLHPWCEAAVSRALREDLNVKTLGEYTKTQLYEDVMRSSRTLVPWTEENDTKIKVRLYKTIPACFLLAFDDVCFVEQYHFGTGGRASGKVPIAEVRNVSSREAPEEEDRRPTTYYGELIGHFDHMWKMAEGNELNQELLLEMDSPSETFLGCFRQSVFYARPDLDLELTQGAAGEPSQQHGGRISPEGALSAPPSESSS